MVEMVTTTSDVLAAWLHIPYMVACIVQLIRSCQEIEMINLPNREKMMKKSLEKIKSEYDFIIIDCSPSLGLITVNALSAADSVLIPVQCEYFALEGLGKLLTTIKTPSPAAQSPPPSEIVVLLENWLSVTVMF